MVDQRRYTDRAAARACGPGDPHQHLGYIGAEPRPESGGWDDRAVATWPIESAREMRDSRGGWSAHLWRGPLRTGHRLAHRDAPPRNRRQRLQAFERTGSFDALRRDREKPHRDFENLRLAAQELDSNRWLARLSVRSIPARRTRQWHGRHGRPTACQRCTGRKRTNTPGSARGFRCS